MGFREYHDMQQASGSYPDDEPLPIARDWQGDEIKEVEPPGKKIFVWTIEPHNRRGFDYAIERDYHKAGKLAEDILASLMDLAEEDELRAGITIKIGIQEMTVEEYHEALGD